MRAFVNPSDSKGNTRDDVLHLRREGNLVGDQLTALGARLDTPILAVAQRLRNINSEATWASEALSLYHPSSKSVLRTLPSLEAETKTSGYNRGG